jgi:anti-sigma regulatory factor (Ser/Thr protein kinase)
MGFLGLIFVGSETALLSFGAWMHIPEWAVQFHRIEQLATTFFIVAFPLLITHLLQLNKAWKNVNRVLTFVGLACAVSITIIAFAAPELFISMTKYKATWLIHEVDHGRGQEGFLYTIRDGLLALFILYGLVCITVDLIWNKKISFLIFPFLGLLLAIYGGAIDILYIYTGIHFDPFPVERFTRFGLGITMFILLSMAGSARKFIDLSRDLEVAHKAITISEEKYRILVEGTQDWIFTMEPNLKFLASNNVMLDCIGSNSTDIKNLSFIELIYVDPNDNGVTISTIYEKIEQCTKHKQTVQFKATLKTKSIHETKDYLIKLEYFQVGDRDEIIGKASEFLEDTLLKYFYSERQKFIIENHIATAEEISNKLVKNLKKYMDQQEIAMLRLGLREMIINAIEHGNLGIDFDEKTRVSMDGNYLEFILERQKDPKYKSKQVIIEYQINPEEAIYKIVDQGEGFNHYKVLDKIEKANEELLDHGRGIWLASQIFDKITFNPKGNQVLLTKKMKNHKEQFSESNEKATRMVLNI